MDMPLMKYPLPIFLILFLPVVLTAFTYPLMTVDTQKRVTAVPGHTVETIRDQ